MRKFSRIASRLFNTPLMLRPEKAEMLCAALVDRLGIAKLDTIDGTSLGAAQLKQRASDWMDDEDRSPVRRAYDVERGVARIGVDGTLVHKLGGVMPWSGMIGYDCLRRIYDDARANDNVGAILFDGDTPGGETAGCFEFAKHIYATSARFGGKPTFFFANEMACSAGYALACACDKVAATQTSLVGSIGVWTMLVDLTKGLDKNGIAVTMIRAGDRKARGGPYEKADQEIVDKLQAWVDETWTLFADLVGQCRGIDPKTVLSWEGDWFVGDETVELGLVDAIDTPDAIFEAVAAAAR